MCVVFFFFFQAEDGIRDGHVTGVQTCALPIWRSPTPSRWDSTCRCARAATTAAQIGRASCRERVYKTGGVTEFEKISLIHQEAPMYRRGLVPDVRQGVTRIEVVKMQTLARLML